MTQGARGHSGKGVLDRIPGGIHIDSSDSSAEMMGKTESIWKPSRVVFRQQETFPGQYLLQMTALPWLGLDSECCHITSYKTRPVSQGRDSSVQVFTPLLTGSSWQGQHGMEDVFLAYLER